MRIRAMALVLAGLLVAAWSVVTWLLEGRLHTFLRPEAAADRIAYAVLGNLLTGIALGAACVALLVRRGDLDATRAGFPAGRRTVNASLTGLVLGLGAYLAQGAPSLDPVVLVNAYSQVFVVSAAEVMVCWCLAGAVVEAALAPMGRLAATLVAALLSATLFGLYHFAHSPPFDTWPMVLLLTGVGLVTGAFFFASRDALGTMLFHNFLGTFGVLQALATADAIGPLERVQPALVAMAVAALLLVIGTRAYIRREQSRGIPRARMPR